MSSPFVEDCTKIGESVKFVKNYFPFFAAFILVCVTFFAFFFIVHNKQNFTAAQIHNDLKVIVEALESIDSSCDILSFDRDHTVVDFLTVKDFVGSEVGGLNLARPQNWSGPYLDDNPEAHTIAYEIVHAADGFFLMPGRGVKLPNGYVVGKDFVVTHETNVADLIKEGAPLWHNGQALAERLTFKIGDWGMNGLSSEQLEVLSETMAEFNEAIPYAQAHIQEEEKARIFAKKIELAREV